ncbi:acyltransferase [Duganella sp. HH105]|uniref:acyltransferase family protein n=1 Tax=Duganella sp. HH105 TaxID=1781067 RepID=UPI000877D5A9|nr:acyltransferase [Duganella sp. HH105]OEZ61623.1 O-acetyltransferase OatA [Duganella sp. HH105]
MAELQSRMQSLDGLRAVSILLVVTSHAWLGHVIPGGLGVTIFFFISGFIITRVLLAEHQANGKISISKFYFRRFFRLMPALLVYLLIALLVMAATAQPLKLIDFAAVLFYFSNYYQVFVGFAHEALTSPLRITWSLAIEEHYYFIYPALFAAMVTRWRAFLGVIAACVIAVLCWRVYLVADMGINDFTLSRIYMGTDTRVDSIFYGAGLALLSAYNRRAHDFLMRAEPFWIGMAILLGTLLLRNDVFRETIRYTLQGIAMLLLFNRLLFADGVFSRFLSLPVMSYIGRISYSLYLYHWLVLGLVAMFMPENTLPAKWAVFLPLSFLCAHLSYTYIEKPFLSLSRVLLARKQPLGLAS